MAFHKNFDFGKNESQETTFTGSLSTQKLQTIFELTSLKI